MMARRTKTQAGVSLDAHTRVCVLSGTEGTLKRQHLDTLRQALARQHGEVETLTYDGKTCPLAEVLDELRSFGLVQQHKVVIVDDADAFVSTHRQALERYTQAPVDHATLVLRCERWNRGKLDQLIQKVGALVRCDPPTPAQAKAWLMQQASQTHQHRLTPEAATRLVERLGVDLARLGSELAKLTLLVQPGEPISPALIDQTVGRSSEEQAWAVQESILSCLVASGQGCGPAIEKIHEIVDLARQSDVFVLYCVADLIRKLALAVMMKRSGMPPRQITSELRFFGPRQAAVSAWVNRVDDQQALSLLDAVIDCDARSKSGLGDAIRNIECFCARMSEQLR